MLGAMKCRVHYALEAGLLSHALLPSLPHASFSHVVERFYYQLWPVGSYLLRSMKSCPGLNSKKKVRNQEGMA